MFKQRKNARQKKKLSESVLKKNTEKSKTGRPVFANTAADNSRGFSQRNTLSAGEKKTINDPRQIFKI